MSLDLETLLLVTTLQCALLSFAILYRQGRRPEAWFLLSLVWSSFLYLGYKLGLIELGHPSWQPVLSPVAASETLPGALILGYAVFTLFDCKSRWSAAILVLPLLELVLTLLAQATLEAEAVESFNRFKVSAGQVLILVAGLVSFWLARRHYALYPEEVAANARELTYVLLLPGIALLGLNALWVLSSIIPMQSSAMIDRDFVIVTMIITFQAWLITFLIVGPYSMQKPLLSLLFQTPFQEGRDFRQAQEDFVRIKEVMMKDSLYLDPEFRLDRLARTVGMNRTRVSAAINAQEGLNFSTLVNQMRVEHAKLLLTNGNQSISAIAFDSGFNSKATFNRVFKECVGRTPREWRGGSSARPAT